MQVSTDRRQNSSDGANKDVFSRVMDWWAGTAPDQPASRDPESRNPECEEFLRQRESPDTRVLQSLSQAPVFASPEEEWRHDCMAFAKVKNLQHVQEMRAFYIDPGSDGGEGDGQAIVVGVAAHYKKNVASQEELLLHIVKEMEKVGPSKEYVLVYFNADAQLSAIPDTIFLQQVHAALHPSHKRNLKAFYVVHPTTLLKYWIFMLRLAMPEIYGRVTYINRLADLQQKMVLDSLDIPQHVQDYDASLQ